MPTPSTAKWPKPKNEDDFEDIAVDFLRMRWKDPNAQRHGRRGQRQHGVDIIGHPPRLKGRTFGGQCKNMDALSLDEVVAEVEKAKGFPGGIAEFYVVTSADRDVELQAEVREHFKTHTAPFHVEVIFWQDVTADLSGDDALVAKHWKGFGATTNAPSADTSHVWLDREGAKDDETTEFHLELTIRCDGIDLDAAELRAALETEVSKAPSDYTARSLLQQKASYSAGMFTWSESKRSATNVLDKWQMQISDDGRLTRRWSQFSNLGVFYLKTYHLCDQVVSPVRKFSDAIHAGLGTGARTKTHRRISLALAVHSSVPIQLSDDIHILADGPRYSSGVSANDWTVSFADESSMGATSLALRLLNRAIGRFVYTPLAIEEKKCHHRPRRGPLSPGSPGTRGPGFQGTRGPGSRSGAAGVGIAILRGGWKE